MGTMHSRLLLFFVTLAVWWGIGSHSAFAQRAEVGGNFLLGLPQNEFRDNVIDKGAGLSGNLGGFIENSPVMIGVDIGFLNYGSEGREEIFSETIPDVTVDVRTTNNILMLHGFVRIQPQKGSLRPYVEGLYGFKYLFTRTTIRDNWFEDPIASSTNFDDLAASWGLGTGVDIKIWEGRRRGRHHKACDISLNLSTRYLWGSKAEYLKEGSITREPDGTLTYSVYRSRTDMLVPQFGLRFRF